MCVKPAALTIHSPPKTSARPRTATRPPRALLLPHAAPTYAHAAPTHARRPHHPFSTEALRSPPHSDTPFPSTSAPPRSPDARPRSADARPQAARCTPADLTTHSRRRLPLAPAQRHALPEHFRAPTQRRCTPAGCAMHSSPTAFARPRTATRPRRALPPPTQRRRTPAGCAMHSPQPSQLTPRRRLPLAPAQRHAVSPSVPLWAQKNGTAQCMCDAECLGRPSLRSVIWVGEPRAVRRRCGALACRRGA